DDENLREVQRLAQVAEGLKRLPVIEPPPGAWERIAAAAGATRRRPHRRAAYRVGIAAAAVLAAAAVVLTGPWRAESHGPATADAGRIDAGNADAENVDAGNADAENGDALTDLDYDRLVAESLRLEMLLAELAPPPRLTNAGTARTIADLEDQIVRVDAQLMYAEARDADPRYRQALWSERVEVMNALLH